MNICHMWVAACIVNIQSNDQWGDHGLEKEENIRYGVE